MSVIKILLILGLVALGCFLSGVILGQICKEDME